MAKQKNKGGRPRKEIPEAVRKIILGLIGAGDSDNRVQKITHVQPREWKRLAAENEGFAELLDRAEEQRDGGLANTLRESMINQIKKGHPWWAKLAIHNYNVLLKDPDVIGAAKVKKLLEQAKQHDDPSAYVETNPSLAAVAFPPGAMPSGGIGRPIQNSPSGTAQRENGNSQADAGKKALGDENHEPPVE